MGNQFVFNILPFDPMLNDIKPVRLSLDMDELAARLREKWPDAEVRVEKSDGFTDVFLYIPTQWQGMWNIAGFLEADTQAYVLAWPKPISKELIYWYRQYVPAANPLFVVVPDAGFVAELKAPASFDDIEALYIYPVPDDKMPDAP